AADGGDCPLAEERGDHESVARDSHVVSRAGAELANLNRKGIMRYVQKRWLTAAAVLACLTAAPVRGDEVAEKGREILNRYREAVVTVPVVLRVSGSSGRSSESRQELTGTVVDPSGLTVLALSAVDPTDIYRRLSQNTRTDIEVMDIKIVQADQ